MENEIRGPEDIVNYISNAFTDYGGTITFDDEVNIRNIFPEIVADAIEDGIIENEYNFDSEPNYSLEDIAGYLFEQFDCELIAWETDEVFESPGCSIYVLSFIAKSAGGKLFYSLNNVFEFC